MYNTGDRVRVYDKEKWDSYIGTVAGQVDDEYCCGMVRIAVEIDGGDLVIACQSALDPLSHALAGFGRA